MNALWTLLEGGVIDGRYHLEKLLGAGGYGAVFRASEVVRDRVIRQLAVKLILVEDGDRQLHELKTALNVQHPNLIRGFGCGETVLQNQLFLFLLMELAEYSLEERLQQGTLTTEETKKLVQDVAAGLSYLHDSKRVHRDLTPGNLFWVEELWKIGDFGLTRQMGTGSRGITSNLAGRRGFAPPEAYQGVYYPASDVWSLGIVTVYALTKQIPFNSRTDEELDRCVVDCNLSLTELPGPFNRIVQRCLIKDHANRWTAQQVLRAITTLPRPSAPPLPHPTPVQQGKPILPPKPPFPAPVQQGKTSAPPTPIIGTPAPKNRAQAYQEALPGNIGLAMVAIPGGTFLMGSPNGEGEDSERPQHRVSVPGFYMGKYAVTNAEWKAVMRKHPSSDLDQKFLGDNQPVVGVSWEDAEAFCQKLSQISGKAYRLPSEAEWEYACRAGSTTRYCFGDQENLLGQYAWYEGNSNGSTHPVGEKQGNAFGLYDMHGNVWEWCLDHWHDNYQGAPSDGSAWLTNYRRILRGGSWFFFPRECRSACRDFGNPDQRYYYSGFRVICEIRGL